MGTLFLQNEVPIMAKKRVQQDAVPLRHHLDKRAASLLTTSGGDDDLLTTPETAAWLQTSEQWLEIGRVKGYGPPSNASLRRSFATGAARCASGSINVATSRLRNIAMSADRSKRGGVSASPKSAEACSR